MYKNNIAHSFRKDSFMVTVSNITLIKMCSFLGLVPLKVSFSHLRRFFTLVKLYSYKSTYFLIFKTHIRTCFVTIPILKI